MPPELASSLNEYLELDVLHRQTKQQVRESVERTSASYIDQWYNVFLSLWKR